MASFSRWRPWGRSHKVYMTHHFRDEQRQRKSDGGAWTGPDFTAAFHEFAVEWSPERVVWFVDGTDRFRSEKSLPTAKMYTQVNPAVGGG
jgi:beta-glucanase (GH16 family)